MTVADTGCAAIRLQQYKRTLTIQTCAGLDPKYITWTIPGGSIGL
jgi:hypothetical protein